MRPCKALVFPCGIAILSWACDSRQSSPPDDRGAASTGGSVANDGGNGSGGAQVISSGGAQSPPEPKFHPPPGIIDCTHAEVEKVCADGWCKLPTSCFVMGAPEGEWYRGRDSQNQTAVTLTHPIEIQQEELTRGEWQKITGTPAPGPDLCTDPECPVAMVSWWDAVHAANMLSKQKGLESCYEPVDCTGTLGVDLACEGVADPDKSVYDCEGYRLPTRAEAEYAARAGTISTWYSGDITPYSPDNVCAEDPALELIAWYCNNSDDRPHVGGELAPNDFGLYDMIGNMGEWSNEEAHYSSSPGGPNPRGEVEVNTNRLRFGGQYNLYSYLVRTAGLSSAPCDSRAMFAGGAVGTRPPRAKAPAASPGRTLN